MFSLFFFFSPTFILLFPKAEIIYALQVHCKDLTKYVVDLIAKYCTCRRRGLCGIPCPHAIARIKRCGLDIYDFVHSSLSKSCYEQVYSHHVKPINGHELWKKTGKGIVVAPDFKIQRGRPRKNRCKEPEEYEEQATKNKKLRKSGLVNKCRKYGREGHNKKTCHKHPIPTTTPAANTHCNINPGPITSSPAVINPSLTTQGFMPTPAAAPQSSTQAGRRSKFTIRRSHN